MKLSKIMPKGPPKPVEPPVETVPLVPELKPPGTSIFKSPLIEKGLCSSVPCGSPVTPVVSGEPKKEIEVPQRIVENKTVISPFRKDAEKKRALSTYKMLINFSRETVALNGKGDFAEVKSSAENVVEVVLEELEKGNDELLVLTAKTTNDNTMYSHLSNTCILAIRLGLGLTYSKEKSLFLGTSALLHEAWGGTHIDLTKGVIKQRDNERLTREIYEQIQTKDFAGSIYDTKELNEMAKVIGLVDIYEGLSHPRKLRERKLPHEVLKMFIRSSDEVFEHSVVKKLIEELSIYPPGSYVRLNSGQIGFVIKANKKFPTRPVVEVIFDRDGVYQEKPQYVNLLENAMTQISDAVDEDKLSGLDKKGLMEISMHKWWTE
ncbi:MAG: hypothetical protein A2452_03380 [Candidatus Firestonebacteria bacterium RIFOXYC2_FULL_39_67]|nr:MAG: hypothetical protein A2536_02795 [Candidatus Firestonebacteria bacterium RIFOXYD2_FULL_39_29]OGF55310.1 MAG: hypothetical protein A2452_03380 [Candidatus Firestonebacteria bacterium RIFOXYC2_FULL_39_67]